MDELVRMVKQVATDEQVGQLFRVEAGLLAFILAFYALCARERRAPYITHTVYSEIGLVLFAVLFTLLTLPPLPGPVWLDGAFASVAWTLVFLATLATLKRVYSIANRDLRLRDDKWWQVLPVLRHCHLWYRRLKHAIRRGRSYEHQSLSPDRDLSDAIVKAGWTLVDKRPSMPAKRGVDGSPGPSATLSLLASSYQRADTYVLNLAALFLHRGHYVQYTPCARHPLEFLLKLQSHLDEKWQQAATRVVVVDGYTPHFGFHDSVHETRTTFLKKELGVKVIRCPATFAGIHTATTRAFNLIRSLEGGGQNLQRKPALLIFEATYALVDLESLEQYRRFMRHVIPSERMWGSMFTTVVELGVDEDSKTLLQSYSDYFVDSCTSPADSDRDMS